MLRSPTQSRLDALKRVPLFAGLGKRDLAAVGRISREVELPAGKELIREGQPGRQFYVLLDGEAEVHRGGVEINRLGPGDFFGEISLLSGRPTTASVATNAPARVVAIARGDFRQLLHDMPLLQMKVIRSLAERLPDEFYWEG